MPSPSVVFRCDARPGIGGGHVVRCLSLARVLAGQGWQIVFAVAPGTPETVPRLRREVAEVLVLPEDPEQVAGAMRQALPRGCDALVLDPFVHDSDLEAALAGWATRIVALDDAGVPTHRCDAVVCATRVAPAPRADSGGNPRWLLGPAYALLDPRILAARPLALARRQTAVARRLLVFYGLTDRQDMVGRSLQALSAADLPLQVDAVLGRAAPGFPRASALCADSAGAMRLHADIDMPVMVDLLVGADLALGAAGGAALERCCLGLPSIVTETADNQRPLAETLQAADAVCRLAPAESLDDEAMTGALRRLVGATEARARLSDNAAGVCDGRGAERVAAAISELLAV